jgi:hypothetical protein
MAGRQQSTHPTSTQPRFSKPRLGESSLHLVQQVSHGDQGDAELPMRRFLELRYGLD